MVNALIDRRSFCGSLLLSGLVSAVSAQAKEPRIITDMAGRVVRLASTPKRIVLLEAHDIVTMGLLQPDPASLVVGWAGVDRIDSDLLQERFTRHHRIDVVGKQTAGTISIEGLFSLSPDLVVANFYMAPRGSDDILVKRLENAGIPVVFSDLSSNADHSPSKGVVADLRTYMRMWGEILNAQQKAAAFTDFFNERLTKITDRLVGAVPVTTYLEVQSTIDDCCWAAGKSVWGELLALAGGKTLPGVTAPWYQKLQLEYLLTTPFDVYIASGGGWNSERRPAIGPGLDSAKGREGLQRLTQQRTGFDQLSCVRNGRVYGIWTGLITVPPLNILFIEVVAKWLHPDRFADIDPNATLAEINEFLQSESIDGPLWVSLQE